jgi:hypothetical protein
MNIKSPVSLWQVDDVMPLTRHTAHPAVQSEISIQGDPNAVCYVHLSGDDDPDHSIKVYTGPDGNCRFHVEPYADAPVELAADFLTEGRLHRYPISVDFSRDPAHYKRPARITDSDESSVRQGLSPEEAQDITNEEALSRDLPFRPDPETSPHAYRSWLRAVSSTATRIDPHIVTSEDVTHGKAIRHDLQNSPNWSGYELIRSPSAVPFPHGTPVRSLSLFPVSAPCDFVTGTWRVPAVSGGALNVKNYSSMWVGLDGDGTLDLVQAGTEHDSIRVGDISLTSYYLWTEFLPQQPTEQVIPNFPVAPGDELLVEVWVGTGDGPPTLSGTSGRFFIMNMDTGAFATWATPRGSTQVGGSEAVWIMERPTLAGNVLPSLANYGSATMYDARAQRVGSSALVPFIGAYNRQVTMTNGPSTLATATVISDTSMRFDWIAFD